MKKENEKSKYELAKCYYFGREQKQDYKKAYELFYKLAEKNDNIDAKYYLGLMYLNGEYVEQNYGMAFNIFQELANLNDYYAKMQIAEMNYNGLYVKQDYNKALEIYLKLYEEKKDNSILPVLAEAYYYARGVEQDYSKAREYAEIYLKDQDDVYLEFMLGEIYFYGRNIEINYKISTEHFEKSINENSNDSFYYLGEIYEKGGYGIDKDENKSKYYFYKIEKDLCNFLIFYALALCDNEFLQFMSKIVGKNRKELEKELKEMPSEHPSIIFFHRLDNLNDEQYYNIVKLVKKEIVNVISQNAYELFEPIINRELIYTLSDIIIHSSECSTLKGYFQSKIEQKEPKIMYFIGILLNMQNKDEQGWKMIEESANQNYEYAKYELAVKNYENQNLSLAEKYATSLLDSEDSYLLSLVQDLLGKIYYYGGNNVKKDTNKALDFFEQSNKNFDGYEKQQNKYIENILNDNSKEKRERDSINTSKIKMENGHYSYNRDAIKKT